MNQAEIDALRREHSASSVGSVRDELTPPGTPSLPPLDIVSAERRPTSPFMKPLELETAADGGSEGKTPPSAVSAARTEASSLDEPCTYEVEGIGGRIPRGVDLGQRGVDLSQMGMEEWDTEGVDDDAAPMPLGAEAAAEPQMAPAPAAVAAPPQGSGAAPVDTWKLVLDNPPSAMMAALDDCPEGVDAVNEMGYTCVMWAALYGKEEHLIVLLECEANLALTLQEDYYSKTYPAGSTALDIARITQVRPHKPSQQNACASCRACERGLTGGACGVCAGEDGLGPEARDRDAERCWWRWLG